MRIRKRPLAATSSGNPELHESSNGGLHLHAGSKSNPSLKDPRCFLLPPAGIIKQDHLLLAGSGHGATHRLSPTEAVSPLRKPYIVVSSGVESCEDGKVLMMKKAEGNPRAKSVQHHEVKHMDMHDDDDNVKSMDMKECNELGLLRTSGEAVNLAEACRKEMPDMSCKGSALDEEINANADPGMVDASDYPRKVRPLQLILSSEYSPTAPKLPLPLYPTSSSSTLSCTPPPLPCKFDKAVPCVPTKTHVLPSSASSSLIKQIVADVKSRDEMRLILTRNEDSSSQNNSDQSVTNRVGNRAEFKSCSLLQKYSDGRPVSTWQGHRRPRSHLQGGRGFNGVPGVNAVFKPDNTQTNDPILQKRKKPAIDILVGPCISVQAPIVSAAGNGELKLQDCHPALKNKAHTKETKNEPLFLSTSTACVFPTSGKMIGSFAAARSLETERVATTAAARAYDDHVASVAPAPGAAASDHELELDSMRCRRKDGRRWRCKEQVVKAGSPFCHYHTLKMREKHAATVARRLLKQRQGEVKISGDGLNCPDFMRNSNFRRANKRRKMSSLPTSIAVQDGYGRGCKGAEDEGEEETNNADKQKKMDAKLGEQHLQESLMLRRRWRKKCKPCIRRLHDIHDRARPAATDGLDFFNPCAEDTYKDTVLVRSRSPLPECLLNTDPYEWRPDFP